MNLWIKEGVAVALCFFVFASSVNAQLIDGNEMGFNGQSLEDNFDELVNGLYSNSRVTTIFHMLK